jgi:lipopolysaccharide transport system permease protein
MSSPRALRAAEQGEAEPPEHPATDGEPSGGGAPSPDVRGPLRAIEPPARGLRGTASELWRHRAAFSFFVRRFLDKRIGRTFLGYLWFLIPVLMPLFMGSLVFGGILGVAVPGVPYFLYFIVASCAWLVFSQTAYFSLRSLEIMRSEIRRVYVPRLLALASGVTFPIIAMLIFAVIIACAVGFYALERDETYIEVRPELLLAPCGIAMLIAFGLAVALWFAPLAPRARDVRRLAGYVLAFWYFLTPVIYPIEEIPEDWRFLASFNPVTAPIELVKEGLLGVGEVTSTALAVYAGALLLTGGAGLLAFAARERRDLPLY